MVNKKNKTEISLLDVFRNNRTLIKHPNFKILYGVLLTGKQWMMIFTGNHRFFSSKILHYCGNMQDPYVSIVSFTSGESKIKCICNPDEFLLHSLTQECISNQNCQ